MFTDEFSRARLLAYLGALGGTALLSGGIAGAQTKASRPSGVIDVHHHVSPTNWLSQGGTPDEARVFNGWSVEKTLRDMDAAGVQTAYVSLTVPGHRFDDPASARRVSRECNEYMASLRAQHPGRFGFFALVPMPNVTDTLAEIAYAYETLKADGIGMYTSYGENRIGNTNYDAVFAELNRRNAVVFVHPSLGPCCGTTQPLLTTALIEYGTDTTRAIAEYIFNRNTQKFPNVKMIWSHLGGTMPFLVTRFQEDGGPKLQSNVPNGFINEARKCYYDTAQVPSRGAMLALRDIIPASNILFGTDYPYKGLDWTETTLSNDRVLDANEMRSVLQQNAAGLFRK